MHDNDGICYAVLAYTTVDRENMAGDDALVAVRQAVRAAYEQANLKQKDVAERLTIDQTTVSKWVTGERVISWQEMLRLEEACGLPPGWVLRRAGIIRDAATTEDAIAIDTALDARGREYVLTVYRLARERDA